MAPDGEISNPPVVEVGNSPHIILGFGIMRHARATRHRSRTRVISSQSQIHVAAVTFQKRFQVPHPRIHVLLRVKRILHVQTDRAVCGISCISPIAPLRETALELKFDSTFTTARTRFGSTLCRAAAITIEASISSCEA